MVAFPPRSLFEPEHDDFRRTVRRFCEEEVVPAYAAWEQAQMVPRPVWKKAGRLGMLCGWLPSADGGPGGGLLADIVVCEELGRIGATAPGFSLHSLVVAPYLVRHGTAALKAAVVPGLVSGEQVAAIAMTEPGTGSDLAAIRTRCERVGDGWVLSGQKTFITHGHTADVVVVAAKTESQGGAHGLSLFAVTGNPPGFTRGRNLHKIGQHALDTAELFFDRVPLSADHLLGEPGKGFGYLMEALPQERLLIAVQCQARAEAVFAATVAYVKDRSAFGRRLADFQNTRFTLAELWAELQAGRALCDSLLRQLLDGRLDAVSASTAKLWHSEMLGRVTDECLQLHGGYGYMQEYPVSRAWLDARVERIYGGTSEIMKEIIARDLCDDGPAGPSPQR